MGSPKSVEQLLDMQKIANEALKRPNGLVEIYKTKKQAHSQRFRFYSLRKVDRKNSYQMESRYESPYDRLLARVVENPDGTWGLHLIPSDSPNVMKDRTFIDPDTGEKVDL